MTQSFILEISQSLVLLILLLKYQTNLLAWSLEKEETISNRFQQQLQLKYLCQQKTMLNQKQVAWGLLKFVVMIPETAKTLLIESNLWLKINKINRVLVFRKILMELVIKCIRDKKETKLMHQTLTEKTNLFLLQQQPAWIIFKVFNLKMLLISNNLSYHPSTKPMELSLIRLRYLRSNR